MAMFRRRERVLDLAAMERAAANRRLLWGMPAPCPECGAPGYLDHIDMVRRVMLQHCPSCFAKWQVAESETVTA